MKPVGFIGLGLMGTPMAANLLAAGRPLVVWNRTAGKCAPLLAAGAEAAAHPGDLFARCDVIIMMLASPQAADAALGRESDAFARNVHGRLIINTATVPPAWSETLARDVEKAGGRYVEAPVSGSRQQAIDRQLVVMLSGRDTDVAAAREILEPVGRAAFTCGPIPGALRMKLAVNLFMIVMVSGLVEAFHFAERAGIDRALLRDVLAASPMSSNVSRVKAEKLATDQWETQAAIADVLNNVRLIRAAAADCGAVAPLMDVCVELYGAATAVGDGGLDMVAIAELLRRRSMEMAAG
ncbi:MAG TPA: NAD(P)-dependent oxidoreductase [Sphingomonadales bacterium]